MNRQPYLTAPPATTAMPPGVPYIVVNEAAERFSYYGMKQILFVFMTKYLVDASRAPATMTEPEARFWIHTFVAGVYALPLIGALIADGFWGKYRTVLYLSVVYCFGHLALSLDDTRLGLAIGLSLIAIGSGGIKPCVSANVGDQFGASNRHLLESVYGWFYMSINLGSAISTGLTPYLLRKFSPNVAFGVPGVLMFVATVAFWMGRRRFVHIPPSGIGFLRAEFRGEGLRVLGRLAALGLFVAVFWALYDQGSSAWIGQADKMDLALFGWQLYPDQIGTVNPILILIYVPLFGRVVYPLIGRFFPLTPLRKIGIGLFLAAGAFVVSAGIERAIGLGYQPHFLWQVLAYVIMTAAEMMVSVTCLEFFYTQAPPTMKSMIMSLYLLSVSLGNEMTALINVAIVKRDGTSRLPGDSYYWFFVGLMVVTAVLYIPFAQRMKTQTYLQSEQPA